ncbi:palmitoyltransferase zdhhc12-related [Anaeramoeba flamelloides]|uniref:Palmitoyltransferase n=1 Tax=Anaeramoeba flamelloides TaxID=1746091 RepID=A0AAV7YTX7_9EUKA|nr:palmitoyltransferase zdhhc12-related [Anaeramoeba flamelloides]
MGTTDPKEKWIARIGYFLIKIIVVVYSSFLTPTNLNDKLLSWQDTHFVVGYYAIVFLSIFFFVMCWINPGIVTQNNSQTVKAKIGTQEIDPLVENCDPLSTSDSQNKNFSEIYEPIEPIEPIESLDNIGHTSNMDEINQFTPKIGIKTEKQRNGNSLKVKTTGTNIDLLSNGDNLEEPILHECTECQLTQPLRTKHCQICNSCVRRYDHHCYWIGNCVGERNHLYFLLFLIFETIFLFWETVVCGTGFRKSNGIGNWFYRNTISLILMFMLCIYDLCVSMMSIGHSALAIKNTTTWETDRRERITYLKDLPFGFNPFDYGILKNIGLFCKMTRKTIDWKLVSYEEKKNIDENISETRKKFNKFFDNEHYSCC